MALFLPHCGWHVKFTKAYGFEEATPLGADHEKYSLNIIEEAHPDEAVLKREYDAEALKSHPEVRQVQGVWFFTNHDVPELPEEHTGRYVDVCGGRSLIYTDPDAALADLAKAYAPVGLLRRLWKSGPAAARRLARAVLDGDPGSLSVLADALEEAGHADAVAVRELGKEKPAKVKRPRRAGPKEGGAEPAKVRPAGTLPPTPVSSAAAPAKRTATQEVVLVGGMPAGGKTTLTAALTEQGYERLNRDTLGGKMDDLLPRLDALLSAGKSAVLDNLYATKESRAGAVKLAKKHGVPIRFLLMNTSLEDAQFNACLRMMERCGKVLHPDDHKLAAYKDDPGLFPVAVLYKYRKEFQEPTTAEGFAAVEKVAFARRYPSEWTNKAVIFDFDGTLRTHEGKEKFPVKPPEVRALTARAAKVGAYEAQGYLLLGASNQSGVAKGLLTTADAEACFAETLRQLGLKFGEVRYCPHKVPPISCKLMVDPFV